MDGSSGKSNVQMTGGKINNSSGNGVNIVSGTFTLGVKDYPVSTTAPTITACLLYTSPSPRDTR